MFVSFRVRRNTLVLLRREFSRDTKFLSFGISAFKFSLQYFTYLSSGNIRSDNNYLGRCYGILLARVSAREIPGIPAKFAFPFSGNNAVYLGNYRPTYQVNVLKIGGSEWKYKVTKLR